MEKAAIRELIRQARKSLEDRREQLIRIDIPAGNLDWSNPDNEPAVLNLSNTIECPPKCGIWLRGAGPSKTLITKPQYQEMFRGANMRSVRISHMRVSIPEARCTQGRVIATNYPVSITIKVESGFPAVHQIMDSVKIDNVLGQWMTRITDDNPPLSGEVTNKGQVKWLRAEAVSDDMSVVFVDTYGDRKRIYAVGQRVELTAKEGGDMATFVDPIRSGVDHVEWHRDARVVVEESVDWFYHHNRVRKERVGDIWPFRTTAAGGIQIIRPTSARIESNDFDSLGDDPIAWFGPVKGENVSRNNTTRGYYLRGMNYVNCYEQIRRQGNRVIAPNGQPGYALRREGSDKDGQKFLDFNVEP